MISDPASVTDRKDVSQDSLPVVAKIQTQLLVSVSNSEAASVCCFTASLKISLLESTHTKTLFFSPTTMMCVCVCVCVCVCSDLILTHICNVTGVTAHV